MRKSESDDDNSFSFLSFFSRQSARRLMFLFIYLLLLIFTLLRFHFHFSLSLSLSLFTCYLKLRNSSVKLGSPTFMGLYGWIFCWCLLHFYFYFKVFENSINFLLYIHLCLFVSSLVNSTLSRTCRFLNLKQHLEKDFQLLHLRDRHLTSNRILLSFI